MKKTRNPNDPRILRSQRDLATAMEQLLQEKGIDSITIHEIADRAMVSKNTFYNNFKDKEELLEYLFVRYVDRLYQVVNPDELLAKGKTREEVGHRFLEIAVHFFCEREKELRRAIENDHSKTLYWCFLKFMTNALRTTKKINPNFLPKNRDSEVSIHFYAGAITNLVYFYLSKGMISEQEMVDSLFDLANNR